VDNWDVAAARRYHEATKHSPESLRRAPQTLDWSNQPLPYKIYPTLPPIPLPSSFVPPTTMPALDAIAASAPFRDSVNLPTSRTGSAPSTGAGLRTERVPDLATVARLCHLSNGLLRRRRFGDGEIGFRAAACTGALYHIELYLACGKLPGLAAGVYHFDARENALRLLRRGDHREVLVEATAHEPATNRAPAIVVLTSTFWRNAWKYQTRAYRHAYWDGGTVLANLLAVATAVGLPATVVLGFVDSTVNRLIDADGEREATIALVALGAISTPPSPAPAMPPLGLRTTRLSASEVDYPGIRQMHAASSLLDEDAVAAWRTPYPAHRPTPPVGALAALPPVESVALPTEPVETVIQRRRSARRFAGRSLQPSQLAAVLDHALGAVPLDCAGSENGSLTDTYLIVHAVEGLVAGSYHLRRETRELELLRESGSRRAAGHLALGQPLAAEAAMNVYILADLDAVLTHFGNRGYRVAQLTGGIAGGRIDLASSALGLGATGLTFFDDQVTSHFSPSGQRMSVMYLSAIGWPWQRETP
jgi:SagB-type dehydrogenase family enzyme